MKSSLLTFERCSALFKKARYCSNINIRQKGVRLDKNTYLIKFEDCYSVRLYDTDIIDIYPDKWKVTIGGWPSRLTKDRLGTYSPVYITSHKQQYHYYINNGLNLQPFSNSTIITKDDVFIESLLAGTL